ncbi:MAG: hypothetical protein KA783_12545 [Chitinophagales bacterium]|jgi:hypothetical protein|nr:hypothetical protein [Sphingobacteriales bacterium]MBP7535270.1 hypothetical protein [Chitinophagales bacterium]
MNSIKRLLGIIWAALGPLTIGGFVMRALQEIGEKPTQENYIFWIIIITIFTPIALGFMIFGYYSLKGDYDHLEE